MIAIQTKYLGATNTKGSRIKAWTANGKSVTIPYDHALDADACHFKAAKALIDKTFSYVSQEQIANMRYGGTDTGYVFVFNESKVSELRGAK